MVRRAIIIVSLLTLLLHTTLAWAASLDLAGLVDQVVRQASQKLGPLDQAQGTACLTNASYARWNGVDTQPILDLLSQRAAISLGRRNLLIRPGRSGEPLFFMFLRKDDPNGLLMTHCRIEGESVQSSPAMNIQLGLDTSFEPFQTILGGQAFNLVSLANGWAMGIPADLLRGALQHGHLCCGVFSGYFTARFIESHLPLQEGQAYIYIGAPAWCQDDYLIDYLRVTPGTHGYLTMAYPWSRPWTTAAGVYSNLGGIVLRYDAKTQVGDANVLAFNWRWDEFQTFLGRPAQKLDWRSQPWLHHAYNQFLMRKLTEPDYFVSIVKSADLKERSQFEKLTKLGANPLAVLLGDDQQW